MNWVDKTLNSPDTIDTFKSLQPETHENDQDFILLADCNQLVVDIDNEIALIHNSNRDLYRPRFPELESLVQNPIDYAKVIHAIGKEENITQVDLDNVLPSTNIMVVTVTACTTTGKPLAEDRLKKVLEDSSILLRLDADKGMILSLVQMKINYVAPNL